MDDIQRWDIGFIPYEPERGMVKDDDGDFVRFQDYENLKAEVERLTELLHRKEMSPEHGYATTQGPIKVWNGEGSEGIGWELNNPPLRVYVRSIRRGKDE